MGRGVIRGAGELFAGASLRIPLLTTASCGEKVPRTWYQVRGTFSPQLVSIESLRRRRPLPRIPEGIARPSHRVLDIRHPAPRLAGVVIRRLAIVGAQAGFRVAAAGIVAEENGVVVAPGAPAFELAGAN